MITSQFSNTGKINRLALLLNEMEKRDDVAIKTSQQSVSYKQLINYTTQLSKYLQSRVKPGSIVAVQSTSAWHLCATFLGIIDAGCVALLIDKTWSSEWQSMVLADANPALILSSTRKSIQTKNRETFLEWDFQTLSNSPTHLDESAAYLIYTSGTTGKPKASINTLQGFENLFNATKIIFQLNSSDTVLQFSSPSFDAWIWDLCLAFSSGATLAVPDKEERLPGAGLEEFCRHLNVTVATLPPSVLHHCRPDQFTNINTLITAGEKCSSDLIKRWLSDRRLYNAYGPSETAVCATVHQIQKSTELASIGKPIPGVELWIEDEAGKIIENEGKGQLLVGGKGVGLGYLNRPELTNQKFELKKQLFHTGDLVTRNKEGLLYFEGRMDRQIKINGVRVELDQVEHVLEQHPAVCSAFATIDDHDDLRNLLVTFVLLNPNVSKSKMTQLLAKHLQIRLPARVSPKIVLVSDLPVKGSGKVDVDKLMMKYLRTSRKKSPTSLSEKILNIFKSILGIDEMEASDDFFLSGGSSLDLIRSVVLIEKELGFTIPVVLAMHNSTPQSLADAIQKFQHKKKIESELPITMEQVPAVTTEFSTRKNLKSGNSFVTGGTGLLGGFLIGELLRKTKGAIYCLVRAKTDLQATERLISHLSNQAWWQTSYRDRLICLAGEVAQTKFGLDLHQYQEICSQLDCVYHVAANVSWVLSYSALYNTNVKGTQHVIELANESRARLIYVSSIGVHFSKNWAQAETFTESHIPMVGDHFLGYLRSKWVSEQMIMASRSQGLTAIIVRPPFICDRSEGSFRLCRHDFLLNKIHACIEVGYVPTQGFYLDIYPGDILASQIVALSLEPKLQYCDFHFSNHQKLPWNAILKKLKHEKNKVKEVGYREWVEKIKEKPNQLTPHLSFLTPMSDKDPAIYEMYHGDWPIICDSQASTQLGNQFKVPSVSKLLDRYLESYKPYTNK